MKQVEEPSYNNCTFCDKRFKVTSTRKKYCSTDCGYKDKLASKYHCPVCNTETYSMNCDPYCSNNHRKQAVSNNSYYRTCDVCGSMFYASKFDYVCSDYCEEEDTYEEGYD